VSHTRDNTAVVSRSVFYILGWILIELGFANRRTEVVRLTFVFTLPLRGLLVDRHAADGILDHVASRTGSMPIHVMILVRDGVLGFGVLGFTWKF
jgi:hypothetical protein